MVDVVLYFCLIRMPKKNFFKKVNLLVEKLSMIGNVKRMNNKFIDKFQLNIIILSSHALYIISFPLFVNTLKLVSNVYLSACVTGVNQEVLTMAWQPHMIWIH